MRSMALIFLFVLCANAQIISHISNVGGEGGEEPPSAPTYVGNGGLTEGTSTNSINITYPSLAADDILIIQTLSNDNDTHLRIDGWNKVVQTHSNTAATASWYWKRASGGESGTVTVTKTSSNDFWGVMSSWRGCTTVGTPFEVENDTSGNGANSVSSQSITPLIDYCRIVVLINMEDDTYTPPLAGGNYASNFSLESSASTDCELAASSFGQTTAANEPARAGSCGNDYWIVFVLALKPDISGNPVRITDNFDNNPSSRWTDGVGTYTWDSTNANIDIDDGGNVVTYNTTLAAADSGYATVKFVIENVYSGFYFRSDNNMGNVAYSLRYNGSSTWVWRYCTGASCTDVQSFSNSFTDNHYYGIEWRGTGNDTEVKFWDFGATPPPPRGLWGTADATLTNNPGSAADNGTYVGLYDGGTSPDTFDDFEAGDIE